MNSKDVIISVGYRVKSKRGIEFRRWANCVLKEYIIKGYAVNHNRMNQLNEVIRVIKRVENSLGKSCTFRSVFYRFHPDVELFIEIKCRDNMNTGCNVNPNKQS